MEYRVKNKPQIEMTASPSKYPQGHFKEKGCKCCGTPFAPQAPSHLYCQQECADEALATNYLIRNYGITLEDARRMNEEQGSLCAICEEEGFTMADHHKMKLVVDHCHTTGKVRGLLCHNCNRALGLLKDNTERLKKAINYLENTNEQRNND
jgi:hypothetical protein